MFNGVPSNFVTVMVPLAAAVPAAAGFDTAIALPQNPCPGKSIHKLRKVQNRFRGAKGSGEHN
jgi:hypothetical protein